MAWSRASAVLSFVTITFWLSTAHAEPASTTVYRWRDQAGGLHFGNPQVPPPGAEAVELDSGYNVLPAVTAPAEPDLPARKRRPQESPGERPKTDAAKCDSYREKLDRARSRLRAGYKASQYNRLTEQERRYAEKVSQLCP